ncbi:MAG: AraC family transcriptional regulator [Bacteroidales bacterium]|nr:AraC family transcriptional regulator [Bacteroidales bacterium]
MVNDDKYLLTNRQDAMWGLTATTVGYQSIRSKGIYPPQGMTHPKEYLFMPENGRVLYEYQLVYISRGEGVFSSGHCGPVKVYAGNMIMLFPGEWHSYYPDENTGWDEYWIGFKGANMDSKKANGFFNERTPVFNIGISEQLVAMYIQAIEIAKKQESGHQQMLAGIINYMLGMTYSISKQRTFRSTMVEEYVSRAKIFIRENLHEQITPVDIAGHVGLRYSYFRSIFKDYTGFPPSRYITEFRIEKSKQLLTTTDLTSQQIAYECGFGDPKYFCTIFSKSVGLSPLQYRKISRG